MTNYPLRMYHPATGHELVAADEAQAAIYRNSGWVEAPEPEKLPGHEPEPVRYAPVQDKPRAKTAKKPESTDT